MEKTNICMFVIFNQIDTLLKICTVQVDLHICPVMSTGIHTIPTDITHMTYPCQWMPTPPRVE